MAAFQDSLITGQADSDAETERLLDVAREEFIAHGFRRTSIGEIAERAGVSRRTVNRRLGEKDDIVIAVVERDVRDFFIRIAPTALTHQTPEAVAVEALVAGMRECRTHPLVAAVLNFEPETLYTAAFRSPEAMERIRTAVALILALNGSVDINAAHEVADLLLRICGTFLLAPSPVLPTTTDTEVRRLAVTYLVPLIEAARTARS